MTEQRRPGDLILDRYCPTLAPEEHEQARDRLEALARALIEISRRLDAEDILKSDSTHLETSDTIPTASPT